MPLETVRDLTRQLLQAVQAIHASLICHRDLKPDNILITKDPKTDELLLTVIDFSIAVNFENEPLRGKNGLKIWSAPETRRMKDYDCKCDIWSVGCLVSFMLTCKNPEDKEDEPLAKLQTQFNSHT